MILSNLAGQATRGRKDLIDFQRESDEFDARKKKQALEIQAAEKAMTMPFQGTSWDAQIANEAYKFNLGKGMSDAEARQKAIDMVQGGKVDYQMVTDPYTGQSVPVAKPRGAIFGQYDGAQSLEQPIPRESTPFIPLNVEGADPMQASRDAIMQRQEQIGSNPYQRMDLNPMASRSPDVQKQIALKEYERGVKQEEKQSEIGRSRSVIEGTLNNLEKLNNDLMVKEALVSRDRSAAENLKAALGSSAFGQAVDRVKNADVQLLRENYNNARNSLIPFYVSYFDLPATMVDTEEMAQRIISAFGDPSLPYETNQFALENMRRQFGIETKNKSQSESQPTDVQSLINKYAD